MRNPTFLTPGRAELRKLVNRCCKTASDFEKFCSDYFSEIYRGYFSPGMDRVAKLTLLLEVAGQDALWASLQQAFHLRDAEPTQRGEDPQCASEKPAPDSLPSAVELGGRCFPRTRKVAAVSSGAGITLLLGLAMTIWHVSGSGGSEREVASSPPPGMVCMAGGTVIQKTETGDQQATAKPFCIDRNLITVAQYRECVRDGACRGAADQTDYFKRPDVDVQTLLSALCTARLSEHDNYPINCISWDEASTYCHWQNKRLPSSPEWEIAAGSQEGQPYPWGWEPPSARWLNGCDRQCVQWAEAHGMIWLLAQGSSVLLVPRDGRASARMFDEDDGYPTTAPVGSKPPSRPHGLYDLDGNLRQWTTDKPTDCQEASCPVRYILKGGSWNEVSAQHVSINWRAKSPAGLHSEMHGFRCAMNRQTHIERGK